jgi:hypothetical protein
VRSCGTQAADDSLSGTSVVLFVPQTPWKLRGTIEQLRADIESARNREAVESEAMDGSKDRRREVLCCATVALRSVEPPKPPSRCMWSNSAAVAQRRLSIKRPDKVVAALLLHHVGALLYHAAGLLYHVAALLSSLQLSMVTCMTFY